MFFTRLLVFLFLFLALGDAWPNPFWWPANDCFTDIAVTCDDEMTLYVDGQEVAVNTDLLTASVLTLPYCARSIAIHCKDTTGTGGILASFSTGDVTDSSWKCTNTLATDWDKFYFDDSAWPAAVEVDTNSVGAIWTTNAAIDGTAKWIWTAGAAADTDVYCRAKINPCPTAETQDCASATDNPCTASNVQSFKLYHAQVNSCKFIQCSLWRQCFEMPCPPGLVWQQSKKACNYGL